MIGDDEIGLMSGHNDLADFLFLAAAILFVIGAVLLAAKRPVTQVVLYAGLACVAVGWFVL
jgi:hypothetical protein